MHETVCWMHKIREKEGKMEEEREMQLAITLLEPTRGKKWKQGNSRLSERDNQPLLIDNVAHSL